MAGLTRGFRSLAAVYRLWLAPGVLNGYDNVTRQFVSSWIDSFGTGIMLMTGKYDPATRVFTYLTDMDDPVKPGTKVKVREVIRLVGPDTHVMEWYESRGGKDAKTMEIVYTRKK